MYRRKFLGAIAGAAGAAVSVAAIPGDGMSYTKPADGALGGKPRFRERFLGGVDLRTPRRPLDATIEGVCCRHRATPIRPHLIIDDGRTVYPIARRYGPPIAARTVVTKPGGQEIAVSEFAWDLEPWEADKVCVSLGVYVKFPEFNDYGICHFSAAPELTVGNVFSVDYHWRL